MAQHNAKGGEETRSHVDCATTIEKAAAKRSSGEETATTVEVSDNRGKIEVESTEIGRLSRSMKFEMLGTHVERSHGSRKTPGENGLQAAPTVNIRSMNVVAHDGVDKTVQYEDRTFGTADPCAVKKYANVLDR